MTHMVFSIFEFGDTRGLGTVKTYSALQTNILQKNALYYTDKSIWKHQFLPNYWSEAVLILLSA